MKYIFIGLLLQSTVTSEHENREACEGRAIMLREKGVIGKCIEHQTFTTNTSIMQFYPLPSQTVPLK